MTVATCASIESKRCLDFMPRTLLARDLCENRWKNRPVSRRVSGGAVFRCRPAMIRGYAWQRPARAGMHCEPYPPSCSGPQAQSCKVYSRGLLPDLADEFSQKNTALSRTSREDTRRNRASGIQVFRKSNFPGRRIRMSPSTTFQQSMQNNPMETDYPLFVTY